MLGDRTHLSSRGAADRPVTGGASLAADIGRTKDGSETATRGPAQRTMTISARPPQLAASSFLLLSRSFAWRISRRGDDKAVGDHASFMRIGQQLKLHGIATRLETVEISLNCGLPRTGQVSAGSVPYPASWLP